MILICDTGNAAVGVPTLTTTLRGVVEVTVTVRSLSTAMHSGMFGGAAPDALAALISMLATLRDEQGNTTIRGLDNTQVWSGASIRPSSSARMPTCSMVSTCSVTTSPTWSGRGRRSPCWASTARRSSGSSASIQPEARALVSLRVPPGMDAGDAQDALIAHLEAVAPWHVHVEFERGFVGQPFAGSVDAPAFAAMAEAMQEVYGRDVTRYGSGGSIPLCNVFQETFPDAEIMLLGVEEPQSLIHAPNESVDPSEIESLALVEALFLQKCASMTASHQHARSEASVR